MRNVISLIPFSFVFLFSVGQACEFDDSSDDFVVIGIGSCLLDAVGNLVEGKEEYTRLCLPEMNTGDQRHLYFLVLSDTLKVVEVVKFDLQTRKSVILCQDKPFRI